MWFDCFWDKMMDGFVRKWFGKTLKWMDPWRRFRFTFATPFEKIFQQYKQHNQNTVNRLLGFIGQVPCGILGNLRKYHFPRYSGNAGRACVGSMLMLMDCQWCCRYWRVSAINLLIMVFTAACTAALNSEYASSLVIKCMLLECFVLLVSPKKDKVLKGWSRTKLDDTRMSWWNLRESSIYFSRLKKNSHLPAQLCSCIGLCLHCTAQNMHRPLVVHCPEVQC